MVYSPYDIRPEVNAEMDTDDSETAPAAATQEKPHMVFNEWMDVDKKDQPKSPWVLRASWEASPL